MVMKHIGALAEGVKNKAQFLINNPDQIDDEIFKAVKVVGDKANEIKASVEERLK